MQSFETIALRPAVMGLLIVEFFRYKERQSRADNGESGQSVVISTGIVQRITDCSVAERKVGCYIDRHSTADNRL